MAKSNGLSEQPNIVAELGPGNSLGVGLAALISGTEYYFAFDVVERAIPERNLNVFEELVTLFRNSAPIPGDDEFPALKPYLEDYEFPADTLNTERLRHSLKESRLERIHKAIRDPHCRDSPIQYKTPWYSEDNLENESVDMIYSQAVLEHVDDLKNTYKAMDQWLKATGYLSHQIDFKCHETSSEWNGHWMHTDLMWRLIKGKRPYLLNREPHSTHLRILKEQGYRVVCDRKIRTESNITRDDLAPRWRSISDDDMTTSGAFIQAVKTH